MFPNASVVLSYAMTEACSSMTFQCLVQPRLDSSGAVCRSMCQCCSSGAKACACSASDGSGYGKSSNFGRGSACGCHCSTLSSGKINPAVQNHAASASGNSPPAAAICVGWPAAGVEIAVQQLDSLREGEWSHEVAGQHQSACTATTERELHSMHCWVFTFPEYLTGALCFAGEGLIHTRGPHTMLGYWAEGGLDLLPQPGRWLSTGDIGG